MLTENRALLDTLAAALLDRETLTREDIKTLVDGNELPPRIPPGAPAILPAATPTVAPESKIVPPLMGGPEVQPA